MEKTAAGLLTRTQATAFGMAPKLRTQRQRMCKAINPMYPKPKKPAMELRLHGLSNSSWLMRSNRIMKETDITAMYASWMIHA
jgi:hypothetical protein